MLTVELSHDDRQLIMFGSPLSNITITQKLCTPFRGALRGEGGKSKRTVLDLKVNLIS